MSRFFLKLLVVPALWFGLAAPLLADAVTLDDIREMRRERKQHTEILEIIVQRGRAFEMNGATERALKRQGFSSRDLAKIKAAPALVPGKVDPPKAKDGAKGKDKPKDKPMDGIDFAAPGAAKLDPAKDAEYRTFDDRLKRINVASETGVTIHPSKHVRIVAEKSLAQKYLPDVASLEDKLARRFPDPLGTGPDMRVANIVMFKTRYEYEKWVRAMVQVYAKDGMTFTGMDALQSFLRTDRFIISGMFVCCLEKLSHEKTRHMVAYATGYHYMDQLTDHKAPVALKTGLGNVAEVMLLGRPTMMLTSGYTDRPLGGGANPWATAVNDAFSKGEIKSIQQVLDYKTSVMEQPQYAQCWSLASLLSTGSKQMSELVTALRKGEPALASMEKIYGLEGPKFLSKWRSYARAQR